MKKVTVGVVIKFKDHTIKVVGTVYTEVKNMKKSEKFDQKFTNQKRKIIRNIKQRL